MPKTDIVLGSEDVEVTASDLSVVNDDGDSTLRADEAVVSNVRTSDIWFPGGENSPDLSLDVTGIWGRDENKQTYSIGGDGIDLLDGAYVWTDEVVALVTKSDDVEAQNGHFVDGIFGGNTWGDEEPVAGSVEVRDGGGDRTVLLDGSRGVVETTGGDVAEYFPNGTDRSFDGGDVVGLADGAVTDAVADCEAAFVVASTPMLLGNRPPETDSTPDEGDHVPVALLGRVPVRVAADVTAGDRLVATADCRAVPAGEGADGAPTVGRALDSATAGSEATALVGYSPSARTAGGRDAAVRRDPVEGAGRELVAAPEGRDDRIDALEAENEALRDRLAAIEERLAAVEGDAAPTPADD